MQLGRTRRGRSNADSLAGVAVERACPHVETRCELGVRGPLADTSRTDSPPVNGASGFRSGDDVHADGWQGQSRVFQTSGPVSLPVVTEHTEDR
jgi:hypothetical protein